MRPKLNSSTDAFQTRQINPVSLSAFFICIGVAVAAAIGMEALGVSNGVIGIMFTVLLLMSFYVLLAIKIANQWEKAIVLRLGRFKGLRGPGLFWVVPLMDVVTAWVDHRVMVTPFNAEKTLTIVTSEVKVV